MVSNATPDRASPQIDEQFAQMRRESDALFYSLFRYGASEQTLTSLQEQFPNSEYLDKVAEKLLNPDDR